MLTAPARAVVTHFESALPFQSKHEASIISEAPDWKKADNHRTVVIGLVAMNHVTWSASVYLKLLSQR
jgi:hypothetical protein